MCMECDEWNWIILVVGFAGVVGLKANTVKKTKPATSS